MKGLVRRVLVVMMGILVPFYLLAMQAPVAMADEACKTDSTFGSLFREQSCSFKNVSAGVTAIYDVINEDDKLATVVTIKQVIPPAGSVTTPNCETTLNIPKLDEKFGNCVIGAREHVLTNGVANRIKYRIQYLGPDALKEKIRKLFN